MYGLVLGAAKSWNVQMKLGEEFYESVNTLLYGKNLYASGKKRCFRR
jgi:hypothetical protein